MRTRREWVRSSWTRAQSPEGTRGAKLTDPDRGVTYFVTLDTASKSGEVRLASVEVVRDTIPAGPKGYTMKGGGEPRRKGKAGTYLAPYDEGVFRAPVQELITQALAHIAQEDALRERGGGRGIVIAGRQLPPPTPEQLRQHLRDGMTPKTIAQRYDRGQRVVYGWIATAREATPELDWPEVKHGPKKTTDGK